MVNIALDKQNKQIIIEITQAIVGKRLVNPPVVFKKPLAVIPKKIDSIKKIYPDEKFI
tara:strand:+ start:283 stop:456 length:174 start_codon:yes stop_codon:yes gene_type:complete